MMKVFRFIGVDDKYKVKNIKPRNVARIKKDAPKEIYDYLKKYYKKHNEDLYQYIGKNFQWDN